MYRLDSRVLERLKSKRALLGLILIAIGLGIAVKARSLQTYSGPAYFNDDYVAFQLDKEVYSPGESASIIVRVGGQTDTGGTYATSVTAKIVETNTNIPMSKLTNNGRWWIGSFTAPQNTSTIEVTETGYLGTHSVSGKIYVGTAPQNQTSGNQTSGGGQTGTNQTSGGGSGTSSGTSGGGSQTPVGSPSEGWGSLFNPDPDTVSKLVASGIPEDLARLLATPIVWIIAGFFFLILITGRYSGYRYIPR